MLLIGIGVVFAIAIIKYSMDSKKLRNFQSKLELEYGGIILHQTTNDPSFLGLDIANQKIVVGLKKPVRTPFGVLEPYKTEYAFSSIMFVEFICDQEEIGTMQRGDRLDSGTVKKHGKIFLANSIHNAIEQVKYPTRVGKLSLRIHVEDRESPEHEIVFFKSDSKKGSKLNGFEVRSGISIMVEFIGYLEDALSNSHPPKSTKSKIGSLTSDSEDSIANQIRELWELKNLGALTEDEYELEKNRLLNHE